MTKEKTMKRIRFLSIQWHITHRCSNHCRHCYLAEPAVRERSGGTTPDIVQLCKILDRISEFEQKWQATIDGVAIGGGDPLLHPEWRQLIIELKKRGKKVFLMANPETLTTENLEQLASLNVAKVQLSLDGLEETHDYFRSPGSFQRTVAALERLRQYNLPSQVMFTLFPQNYEQLIPLLRFVAVDTAADAFSFDLGCATGAAASLGGRLSATQVKAAFEGYLAEKKWLKEAGYPIEIIEKNSLFRIVRFEQNEFFPFNSPEYPVISGCLAGWTSITIDADGSVMPCRRMPLVAGKLPDESLEKVLFESPVMKRFRRPQFYKVCQKCKFYKYCRGCAALGSALKGDPFDTTPFCFADGLARSTVPYSPSFISMDTTIEEEHELVASHFANFFAGSLEQWLDKRDLCRTLFCLSQSPTLRSQFFSNPESDECIAGIKLDNEDRLFLQYFLERFPPDKDSNKALYYALLTRE